jgi:hypothetical protein
MLEGLRDLRPEEILETIRGQLDDRKSH